ncbi:proteolipid protein 2 isoform X1, partial [Silurus asotus]
LLSLIVTICYAASLYNGYSTVGICELIFAAIFFGIFMMELDKQFLLVNWLWTDFFRAVIGAVLYILTSLICLIAGAGDGARIAGGVFGLIAGILFSYDTYTLIAEIRSTRGRSTVSTGT